MSKQRRRAAPVQRDLQLYAQRYIGTSVSFDLVVFLHANVARARSIAVARIAARIRSDSLFLLLLFVIHSCCPSPLSLRPLLFLIIVDRRPSLLVLFLFRSPQILQLGPAVVAVSTSGGGGGAIGIKVGFIVLILIFFFFFIVVGNSPLLGFRSGVAASSFATAVAVLPLAGRGRPSRRWCRDRVRLLACARITIDQSSPVSEGANLTGVDRCLGLTGIDPSRVDVDRFRQICRPKAGRVSESPQIEEEMLAGRKRKFAHG